MDYYGREISLNAEGKDWISANANLIKTKDIWNTLKSKLNTSYSKDAAKLDSSITNLDKYIASKDATHTMKEASNLLDIVDVLESDFKKQ